MGKESLMGGAVLTTMIKTGGNKSNLGTSCCGEVGTLSALRLNGDLGLDQIFGSPYN